MKIIKQTSLDAVVNMSRRIWCRNNEAISLHFGHNYAAEANL